MGTTTVAVLNEPNITRASCEAHGGDMDSIFASHLPSFRRKAFQYLGNAADAEDAVQDALLSAYKHREQFKGQARMSTWLTAIVINSARMQLRRRPRQIHVPLDEPSRGQEGYSLSETLADGRPTPEDECRGSELTERLRISAEMLSPPLRTTFRLRELDGLSIRETASVLGVPHGTVKAQLARARARLKQLMHTRVDGSRRGRASGGRSQKKRAIELEAANQRS